MSVSTVAAAQKITPLTTQKIREIPVFYLGQCMSVFLIASSSAHLIQFFSVGYPLFFDTQTTSSYSKWILIWFESQPFSDQC